MPQWSARLGRFGPRGHRQVVIAKKWRSRCAYTNKQTVLRRPDLQFSHCGLSIRNRCAIFGDYGPDGVPLGPKRPSRGRPLRHRPFYGSILLQPNTILDGSSHLRENLRFFLRAASITEPFTFSIGGFPPVGDMSATAILGFTETMTSARFG